MMIPVLVLVTQAQFLQATARDKFPVIMPPHLSFLDAAQLQPKPGDTSSTSSQRRRLGSQSVTGCPGGAELIARATARRTSAELWEACLDASDKWQNAVEAIGF